MNTKFILSIIAVLCLCISVVAAAPVVTVGTDSLGIDDAVERSNPFPTGDEDELDDDSDELSYETFSIPVTVANGTVNITDITLISTFSYRLNTDELSTADILLKPTLPITITNATRQIEVELLIPADLDAIDTSFNEVEHSFNLDFATTQGTLRTSAPVTFYVENNLQLTDLEINTPTESFNCDLDEEWYDERLECDDKAEEMRVGEDFIVTFLVENNFGEDKDIDFEDVKFELEDDSDVEADDTSFDENIDADEEISINVDYEVDEDVEDGDSFTLKITAEITDENGARHGFQHSWDIEFNVPDYDVETTFDVNPSVICEGETAQARVYIENEGDEEQDNIRFVVRVEEFRFEEVFDKIVLEKYDDRDNDYSSTVDIPVPATQSAGRYTVDYLLYYESEDSDDEVLQRSAPLTVDNCYPDPEQDTNTNDSDDDTDDEIEVDQDDVPQDTGSTDNDSMDSGTGTVGSVPPTVYAQRDDNSAVLGLSVLAVLLLVVIVALVIYLARK